MTKGRSPGLTPFPSSWAPWTPISHAVALSVPRAKELTWAPHNPEPIPSAPSSSSEPGRPLEGRRPLASQEEVSLARKELAVVQDSSWGPRLGGARLRAQQSRLRSSEETLLLKEA